MLLYITKRLISIVPVLFGITIFAFLIGVMSPGDPVYMSLTRDGISEPTELEIEQKRHELGLDLPLPVQYINWTDKVLKGDLGKSIYDNEDILDEIKRRFPMTTKLSFSALAVSVVFGVGMGTLMTRHRNKPVDIILRNFCTLVISIPSFWMAILLITIFSEIFQLLPTSGYEGPASLVLPTSVLSLGTIGVSARLSRANFIGELNKEYVFTANAKGLDKKRIGVFHIFRNSLIPLITYFGIYFSGILGGSCVVETIFSLPGLGSYAVDAIFNRDYLIIQSFVLITGTTYVLANLGIDILYFIVNPKTIQSVEI